MSLTFQRHRRISFLFCELRKNEIIMQTTSFQNWKIGETNEHQSSVPCNIWWVLFLSNTFTLEHLTSRIHQS